MRFKRYFLFVSFLLWLAPRAAAQDPSSADQIGGRATLVVNVREANGTPLNGFATVRLYSVAGSVNMTQQARGSGHATFSNLPIGEYQIEVTAPGYQVAREDASLAVPGTAYVYVQLRPESAFNSNFSLPAGATTPTVLAPKAQKEVDAAREAIQAGELGRAEEILKRAAKNSPGNPELSYLLAVLYLRQKRTVEAQNWLEKTISLQPGNVRALAALGRLFYQQTYYDKAVARYEEALEAEPNNWENHWMLGAAFYGQGQFERALAHAERAVDLNDGKSPQIQLLRAQSYHKLGDTEKAVRILQQFLQSHPEHAGAPMARDLLARFGGAPVAASGGNGMSAGDGPAATAVTGTLSPAEPELPAREWAPPDVDTLTPVVETAASCALPEVQKAAAKRAVLLAENMQGVAARERIEYLEFNKKGYPGDRAEHTFDYMVTISEVRKGHLIVDEDRTPGQGPVPRPKKGITSGLVALAFVFHPYYADDFEMKCEGLGQSGGQPAWQVYFKQRPDKDGRIKVNRNSKGQRFPIALKGRAWIATNTYQILRMEMDLVAPVKDLNLEKEHMVIEYAPVLFQQRNLRLWLPSSADIYTDFLGQRFQQRHTYSGYMYFAVDTQQKIHDPKDASKEPPPPLN
jgi:tetratricopeptide (TPR) repeat protein